MICYPTPKINIGLNVLRRRPDNFHDIDTLFYPVDAWRDTLEITESEAFSIEIEGADWDPQKDLTVKAYQLLAEEYNLPPVSIRMEKNIPVGAGLGGGSADCAWTIKMLNEMFSLGLTTTQMEEYAGKLGSDCAFFIRNIPQWGSGRGEILEPAEINLSNYKIDLQIPLGSHVSTAEAYRGITPGYPEIPLREALMLPVEEWDGKVFNDFENSVFPAHPEIAFLKDKIYEEGAIYASMTGSGAAVFGIFKK